MKTPVKTIIQYIIENAFNVETQAGVKFIAVDGEDMRENYEEWLDLERQMLKDFYRELKGAVNDEKMELVVDYFLKHGITKPKTKEEILTELLSKCAQKKWYIQKSIRDRFAIVQNFYVDKNDLQRVRVLGSYKDFEEMRIFLQGKIDNGEFF
jgi:hypothetical protein